MKYLFLLPALCATLLLQAQDDALVLQYLFNQESTDKVAKDESKQRNNGTLLGGVAVTEDRFGNECAALRFNGSDGYIVVPDSRSLRGITEEFTATAWLKLERRGKFASMQWITLICKSEDRIENAQSPQYRVQATNVTLSMNTYKDNTLKRKHNFGYDVWFHYAMSFDGAYVREYVNGQLISKHPYRPTIQVNRSDLNIGRDMPGQVEFFPGVMDDLRIYNRALTDRELQTVYKDDSEKTSPKPCKPIAPPCSITDASATPGDCYERDGKSLHDVALTVAFESAPTTGQLVVTLGSKTEKVTVKPGQRASRITIEGLPSDGKMLRFRAAFSADEKCRYSDNSLYRAPAACATATTVTPPPVRPAPPVTVTPPPPPTPEEPACTLSGILATPGSCFERDGESFYNVRLSIVNDGEPTRGQLLVRVGNSLKELNPTERTLTVKGLPADGQPVDVSAYYTAYPDCSLKLPAAFTAPEGCATPPSAPPVTSTPTPTECRLEIVDADLSDCYFKNGRSLYDATIALRATNAPDGATVQLQADGMEAKGSFDDGIARVRLTGLSSNSQAVDVAAYIPQQSRCAAFVPGLFTAPDPCDNIDIGRLEIVEEVVVTSPRIRIQLYDNSRQDGDIVSVKFGDEWLVDKYEIMNRPYEVTRVLDPAKEYILLSKAWNVGSTPPNTLTVKIVDADTEKAQVRTINSLEGVSRAIRIKVVQ